ncbi:MAG: hypothetical protein MR943_03510 [Lachnobacterium sp.]|nr:hypothetical protein [Lachnobacterium sp.]
MIDFHCHILPEMDDGSKDAGMSLAMLDMEREQGVTEVVFTPHFYAQEDSVVHFLEKRESSVRCLEAAADDAGVELLPYHLGAEVYYFRDIGNASMIPELCIGDSGTLLLEMPFRQWEKNMYVDVANLVRRQGLRIVLAHIERYYKFQKDKSVWNEIMELPLECQMNAGPFQDWRKRRMCMGLLKQHDAVLLGSDAHNLMSRCPNLGATCELLNAKINAGYTKRVDLLAQELLQNA